MEKILLDILSGIGVALLAAPVLALLLPEKRLFNLGKRLGLGIEKFLLSKAKKGKIAEIIGDKTIVAFLRGILTGMGEMEQKP